MDLSIVIINWNGLAVLRNCLTSIFGEVQGVTFEVIVVDNASRDESVEMLKREYPQVSILVNQRNRGFAAANNQWSVAERWIIAFFDGRIKRVAIHMGNMQLV